MLPNFIIVGAPKAGTTSLYHYLSEHPDVFMSEPKEVNFFSKEEIEAQGLYYTDFKVKDMGAYQRLFDGVKHEKAVGEGSVSYLYYPDTPKKIKVALPDVKIIILLRNPVERAFSHYLMDLRLGLVDIPFENIVSHDVTNQKIDLFYQQYIELGLYYEQVKRYLNIFGQEKVKIYLQEDLRTRSDDVITGLYAFLGVDKSYRPDMERQHNAFSMPKRNMIGNLYTYNFMRALVRNIIPDKLKNIMKGFVFDNKPKPVLAPETKRKLQDLYLGDIEKLEKVIDRDLSAWK